ncbi:hypothetical protein F5883DRAFT_595368 [Diaporthe sp. PMI_573]|nr:hypothetical protein F5883DRAFT_595368 [Diaporthaceae sp. PMI_573]
MSDNTMSGDTEEIQLAVLGFSDQPGPGPIGNLGGGPSPISQHWFVYRDGQFQPAAPSMGQPAAPSMGQPAAPTMGQPAAPTMGRPAALTIGQPHPTIGHILDSPSDFDSDPDPNRQPNIRFVTIALLSGPLSANYTEKLDTQIDIIEMGPFVTKIVEMLPDMANMVFSKVAKMVSSKVAEIGSGAFANNTISINVNSPQLLAAS